MNGSSEAALLTLMAVFWRREPPAENKIQFSRREVGRLYVILCVQVEKLTGCKLEWRGAVALQPSHRNMCPVPPSNTFSGDPPKSLQKL